jgi:hypothetical protein
MEMCRGLMCKCTSVSHSISGAGRYMYCLLIGVHSPMLMRLYVLVMRIEPELSSHRVRGEYRREHTKKVDDGFGADAAAAAAAAVDSPAIDAHSRYWNASMEVAPLEPS